MNFRLMLVTDRHDTAGRDLVDVVRAAVEGGVDCVQIREKDLASDALLELTNRVQGAVGPRATIVVNGDSSVAQEADVGLHLPEDAPAPPGMPRVWGRSVHSVDRALQAAGEAPDYLLLGTIFETSSKPGLEGSGVALVRKVVHGVHVPVLAIGGIDASNAGEVMVAGATGVAVRSAILRAADPTRAAEAIRNAIR